ncbi:MAG: hypothetical protein ABIR62_05035 [Dokdonella sp.]|uniref:hypothetical protein n=1 Tax=Dokdonella sp. TaxID=2291710 RepID=UPI003264B634
MRLLLGETHTSRERSDFESAASTESLAHGDGHPVMLLPAFATGDLALAPMARAIDRLGYAVHGWNEGRNLGLSLRVLERLLAHAQHIADGAKTLTLIGWSAGGLYAREMARRRPGLVRRVITLGTPIQPCAAELAGAYRWIRSFETLRSALGDPGFVPSHAVPVVPTTAIHSKSDAVVPWRNALELEGPCTENVEVPGGHLTLACSMPVLRIVAARLALAPATDVVDTSANTVA